MNNPQAGYNIDPFIYISLHMFSFFSLTSSSLGLLVIVSILSRSLPAYERYIYIYSVYMVM